MVLPKTITQRYKLLRKEKSFGQSSAEKGLYLDKKTKKEVFIKIDPNSRSLFHEYAYQQFLYQLSRYMRSENVIIPKPLEIIEIDNYVALVMEYLPGKSILKANINTRLEAYMKILKFLDKINAQKRFRKKDGLMRKSAQWQLITLPYFLAKNLLLYSSHASLFLLSAGIIGRNAPRWTELTFNWICHGDINVTNILLYGKKVVILDFACAYISHRYFDISRALNSTWYQKEFHEQLWNRIVSEFHFSSKQQEILKSFVIFNLIQRLSQHYPNQGQELFYLKRLEKLASQ